MIVTLLALGLLFVPSSHAFFRLPCAKPVLNSRVDPIVSPGKPSGHQHTIMGPSGISYNSTYEDLINSDCTTCMVKDDKSAYWVPQLYYQSSNGSLTPVSHGGLLAYYMQRGDANATIVAFPEGLHMFTGDPYVRNNTGSDESKAISWKCIDFNAPDQPQTPGFNNTNCPDGLRGQVFFQSCWDGKNLDSPDHKSHLAYFDGIDNGKCPDNYPVQLMSIFFEVWFYVNTFNQLNDPGSRFVLANGDATGFGMHGDFLPAWNNSVLQRAIDTCTADSGVIQDCPVFQNENRFNSDDEMNSCAAPNPLPNEDVTGPIPYLPGCVAITEGPAPASPADLDPNCLAANGNQTLLQNTSSSSIPVSSSLASPMPSPMPTSGNDSVPSSSLASPLPSTTPASGDDAVLPNSSPTSPLPSTTPASGDDSVPPSSSPASPPSSTTPASGDDSVPSSSLPTVLPTQMPADPPASSTTPTPSSVTPMSNSPAPANPSSGNNDSSNGNGNSSPSLSPSPSFSPASGGPASTDPGSVLPTTMPSSMPPHDPTQTSSSSLPMSSGDGSDGDGGTCAGRPSGSNKTSRAANRSRRRRHHARRAGHGTPVHH